MYNLKIEHPVPYYAGWKKAFDDDPVGRKKSGVRRYQIDPLVQPREDFPVQDAITCEIDRAMQLRGLLLPR